MTTAVFPLNTSGFCAPRYQSKSKVSSDAGWLAARIALAGVAAIPISVGTHVHATAAMSSAFHAESVKVSARQGVRSYSRKLTRAQHEVFQEAILDNAEIVSRGRLIEL